MDELEYINDYFNKNLSPEEVAVFDKRIQQDPAFADEVAFYYSTISEIKNKSAEEKKQRFRQLYNENNKTIVLKPVRKLWPYLSAAAVVAAIVIGFYLWGGNGSVTQMADTYINTNLREMSVTMGAMDDLQKGRSLYNEKKYNEALQQFANILKTDTANIEARKSAGIVSLQLQQYDKALEYFTQVENTSLYINPGKFYRALTLIKRNAPGDRDKAKDLLQQIVNNDLAEKKTAAAWLKNW